MANSACQARGRDFKTVKELIASAIKLSGDLRQGIFDCGVRGLNKVVEFIGNGCGDGQGAFIKPTGVNTFNAVLALKNRSAKHLLLTGSVRQN